MQYNNDQRDPGNLNNRQSLTEHNDAFAYRLCLTRRLASFPSSLIPPAGELQLTFHARKLGAATPPTCLSLIHFGPANCQSYPHCAGFF